MAALMRDVRGMRLQGGMCSPVVVAMVLGALGVVAAMKTKDEADKRGMSHLSKSIGVAQVALSSLAFVAFLWILCYYGFLGAAWFFLLAPLGILGMEVNAVLDILNVALYKKLKPDIMPIGPIPLGPGASEY